MHLNHLNLIQQLTLLQYEHLIKITPTQKKKQISRTARKPQVNRA